MVNETNRSFYCRIILQNLRETKNLWYLLTEVPNVRPKSETIKEISVNNFWIQESFEISNVMKEYYPTISDRLASIFHNDSDATYPLQYLSYSSRQFSFSEVDIEKVHKNLAELNYSRSTILFEVLLRSICKEFWIELRSV